MSGRRGSRLCASWRDFATVLSRRDRCRRRLLLDHRFRSGVGERKVEVETRPLADPAGHVDLAIALVYQTVDHRQTQSRALALVLGGVERLEDAVEGLVLDSIAAIGDPQTDVCAGLEVEEAVGQRPVEGEGSGLDIISA